MVVPMQAFHTFTDFLLVVLGFGLIIFVHELGHFLAARWAGIRVLAFAIGFGPALCSFRKGLGLRPGSTEAEFANAAQAAKGAAGESRERARSLLARCSPTEYRINALPFGGYVKMLGQEDGNPENISSEPDSYQNCKPWRRMVVISAGVIANLITAAAIFMLVFKVGLRTEAPIIGDVAPGGPAYLAKPEATGFTVADGLRPGDRVLSINSQPVHSFNDLMMLVVMSEKGSTLRVTVERPGTPSPLTLDVLPRESASTGMLDIGVGLAHSATLLTTTNPEDEAALHSLFTKNGLAGLGPGMTLRTIDAKPCPNALAMADAFAASGGKPLDLGFTDDAGGKVAVKATPIPEYEQSEIIANAGASRVPVSHLLGLEPVLRVATLNESDRGYQLGLREGDVFAKLGSCEFPSASQGILEIHAHKGQAIDVVVLRRQHDGAWKEVHLDAVTVQRSGQIGFGISTTADDASLVALPSPLLWPAGTTDPTAPGRRPAASGVFTSPGSTIVSVAGTPVSTFADTRAALISATASSAKEHSGAPVPIEFRRPVAGVPSPDAPIEKLTWNLSPEDVASLHALSWKSPLPVELFEPEFVVLQGKNPIDAIRMGLHETRRVMLNTYVTFARLWQGSVKVEQLRGPIGIAHLGTLVANRGFIYLVFFLGLISVNLAVINFIPLPIVDGGQFLFLVFEQIRGRPVPMAVQNVATIAGLAIIGVVFIVVTYNDIIRLLGL